MMRRQALVVALLGSAAIACATTRTANPAEHTASGAQDVTEQALARFVTGRVREIETCYEIQLSRNPTLAGEITIRFAIHTDGSIREVLAVHEGMAEVAACIVSSVQSWQTPFRPVEPVTVEYPFFFRPVE